MMRMTAQRSSTDGLRQSGWSPSSGRTRVSGLRKFTCRRRMTGCGRKRHRSLHFIIRSRLPLPEGAAVARRSYYLHHAPLFAHEMLGEEPTMKVRTCVAPSGARGSRDDVRGEGIGEHGAPSLCRRDSKSLGTMGNSYADRHWCWIQSCSRWCRRS